MLANYPRHNLGVKTSPGPGSWSSMSIPAWLVTKHFTSSKMHRGERLPDTVTVTTAAGGRHLYYRTPPEWDAPRHVVRWLHGVDAHSSGVMVIPPSVGMNLLEYAFTGSSATRPACFPTTSLHGSHHGRCTVPGRGDRIGRCTCRGVWIGCCDEAPGRVGAQAACRPAGERPAHWSCPGVGVGPRGRRAKCGPRGLRRAHRPVPGRRGRRRPNGTAMSDLDDIYLAEPRLAAVEALVEASRAVRSRAVGGRQPAAGRVPRRAPGRLGDSPRTPARSRRPCPGCVTRRSGPRSVIGCGALSRPWMPAV